MKTYAVGMKLNGVLAAVLLAGLGAYAQMPGASGPGMNSTLTKLFGDIKAFTAKAEVQVLDGSQKEIASMPMDFALLDNKVRVEIDMTKAKSKDMPEGAAANLKQMGMARVVSIIRPDKNLAYVIYPDQKALMSMPLPKEESAAAEKSVKMQKTALGKETIDGHPCIKNKVVISDDKGQTQEATTWNATDLKEFPIQILTKERESTSYMRFKQVQFARPDAKRFDPPAGYTEYSSPQEMMQSMMKKMMESAPKGEEK